MKTGVVSRGQSDDNGGTLDEVVRYCFQGSF